MTFKKYNVLLLILVLSILTDVCYSANLDKKNGKQFINMNQAKIDISYFFDKFETVLPDPYYFCSKVSLDTIKWNLIENLPYSITV